ncbi:hypothetical protein PpBr36_01098 [Pyricularia pennisetigena]|uniref:hypothetical protein n=1 Tax=Pyricularia pennisetigena TaxID=1578925 RepID=UPI001154443E|nr:hypothetical protein PpBr36_01098 [Pyricularia pennisetigena]TLS28097.1 hypothetical protein PpBr36_01098 [Pyricularia pennisetigena]
MPSLTQQEPMVCTSKKRRREEKDSTEPEENRQVYNSAVQYKIATSFPRQHNYQAVDHAILMTNGGQLLHQDGHSHNAFFARRRLVPLRTATKRLRMDGEPTDEDHNLSRGQHCRIMAAAHPQFSATSTGKIDLSTNARHIYSCALSHMSTTAHEEIGLGLFCRL